MESEVRAIEEALKYCQEKEVLEINLDTCSLSLAKMITKQRRVLQEFVEIIDNIRKIIYLLRISIKNIFREGNMVADHLANKTVETNILKNTIVSHNYQSESRD